MTTIAVETTLFCGTSGTFDLPEGKTWDDIHEWFIKWDSIHYCLKDAPEVWFEQELDSNTLDIIDWKRPMAVEIYPTDEDGNTLYEESLEEQ